jgi:hypothetical protein
MPAWWWRAGLFGAFFIAFSALRMWVVLPGSAARPTVLWRVEVSSSVSVFLLRGYCAFDLLP